METSTKTFLKVAYQDKDQVKALGALWSPEDKKWFVPSEIDIAPFQAWLETSETSEASINELTPAANELETTSKNSDNTENSEEEFNIKALTPFYLLTANEQCSVCQQTTQVVGLAAEGIEEQGESQLGFVRFDYVEVLPERLSHFINTQYQQYQLSEVFDRISGDKKQCYTNHCQHCNAVIADSKLHSEPSHAFYPTSSEAAQQVTKLELKSTGKVKLTAATAYSAPDLIAQFAKHTLYTPEES